MLALNFVDVANDSSKLCTSWLSRQLQSQSMLIVTGLIINIINVILCFLFEVM